MVFKLTMQTKAEENQNRDFHCHVCNAIFLRTQHSSIFQIIPWNWKHMTNHKVQGKNLLTNDITQLLVQCFVCILHQTLKSKVCDLWIQALKKLFYHMILNNYLCNVLWRFLIKIKSMWRCEMIESTSADFTAP